MAAEGLLPTRSGPGIAGMSQWGFRSRAQGSVLACTDLGRLGSPLWVEMLWPEPWEGSGARH